MTVSSKALIPTAIFKSFRTAGTQRKRKVGGKIKPILNSALDTSQCSSSETMVGMKPCSTRVKLKSISAASGMFLPHAQRMVSVLEHFKTKLNYHQLQGGATGSTSDVS